MRILTCLCLLVTPVIFADVVQIAPSRDNTLYEPVQQDNFELRSNGAGQNVFAGRTADGKLRRGLLTFNIAGAIPAGSTINGVSLTLTVNKVKLTTPFGVSLHPLLSDWGEGASDTGNSQQGRGALPETGDTTWDHTFFPDQFWTNPGGDFSLTSSATVAVGPVGSYIWTSTPSMIADVQNWLDNSSQNFGWIVLGDETTNETAIRYASRENDVVLDRPQLMIDFTPSAVVGACCQGSTCSSEHRASA